MRIVGQGERSKAWALAHRFVGAGRGASRGAGIVRSYCRGLAVLLFKMGGVVDLLVMRI